MTPVLGICNVFGALFFYLNTIRLTPSLFLSHLVPEIVGPNVELMSTKIYYLTDFKHFVSIFSLIFNPIDLPFSLILNLFNPSFSQNLRSDWVQFLFMCSTQQANCLWSTPPPWVMIILPILKLLSYLVNVHDVHWGDD